MRKITITMCIIYEFLIKTYVKVYIIIIKQTKTKSRHTAYFGCFLNVMGIYHFFFFKSNAAIN